MKISIDVKENYKNMKEILKDYPQLTEIAMEAARRAGLKPSSNRFVAAPTERR